MPKEGKKDVVLEERPEVLVVQEAEQEAAPVPKRRASQTIKNAASKVMSALTPGGPKTKRFKKKLLDPAMKQTEKVVDTFTPDESKFYRGMDAAFWSQGWLVSDTVLLYFRIVAVIGMLLARNFIQAIPMLLVAIFSRLPPTVRSASRELIHMSYGLVLSASVMIFARYGIQHIYARPALSECFAWFYLVDQVISLEHLMYPVDIVLFLALLLLRPSTVTPPFAWHLGMSGRKLLVYALFYLSPIASIPILFYKKGRINPPSFGEKVNKFVWMSRKSAQLSWDATQYIPT